MKWGIQREALRLGSCLIFLKLSWSVGSVFSIRIKLLSGLAGLMAILIAVTLLTHSVLTRYSDSIQQLFHEDYDSATAAQGMKEAMEGLVESARARAWQLAAPGKGASDAPGAPDVSRERNVAEFERELLAQEQIADVPGERAATTSLASAWKDFLSAYNATTAPGLSPEQRQDRFIHRVLPLATQVRTEAQHIIDMNMADMESGRGAAALRAAHARWAMHTLAVAGIGIAGVILFLAGSVVLRPVRQLELSARRIAGGDLDLSALRIQQSDEIGRLGLAFNDMAARLRENKRIEHERLVRTQRTTQLAIDSLPDAVVVLNPSGSVELTNETAKRLFSLKPGAQVASLPSSWLGELHAQALNAHQPQHPAGLTGAIHVKDNGQDRYFLPRTYPIYDSPDKSTAKSGDGASEAHGDVVIGAAVVLVDVTELRRLDEIKNDLLATTAHELKTPLTSIRMVMHLIAEERIGPLNARQRELLLAARDDGERLYRIVQTLLDLHRLESEQGRLNTKPTSAEQLIRDAIEPYGAELASRGLALKVQIERQVNVRADPEQLASVFGNLIGNAMKYTPRGGTVTVGTRSGEGANAIFFVSDTGCGIPEPLQHRIFERFFRAPGQSGDSGTGLGLAIVKEIVEAHGGQVWVESGGENAGTTICFALPTADRLIDSSTKEQEQYHANTDRRAETNPQPASGAAGAATAIAAVPGAPSGANSSC
jgi:signal transduction histidine kinase